MSLNIGEGGEGRVERDTREAIPDNMAAGLGADARLHLNQLNHFFHFDGETEIYESLKPLVPFISFCPSPSVCIGTSEIYHHIYAQQTRVYRPSCKTVATICSTENGFSHIKADMLFTGFSLRGRSYIT